MDFSARDISLALAGEAIESIRMSPIPDDIAGIEYFSSAPWLSLALALYLYLSLSLPLSHGGAMPRFSVNVVGKALCVAARPGKTPHIPAC